MKTLLFPVAIEQGDDQHAFGVTVPDLPGCFAAGDTLEQAYADARAAIEAHLEVLIDEGMAIPERQTITVHQANPEYAGRLWGLVEVRDIVSFKKSVRINVSLPEALVEEIDKFAESHHLTRSGFLAKAATAAMAAEA